MIFSCRCFEALKPDVLIGAGNQHFGGGTRFMLEIACWVPVGGSLWQALAHGPHLRSQLKLI